MLISLLSVPVKGLTQSVDDLEEKRGFQDILLDSDINEYNNLDFKKSIKIEDSEEPIAIHTRKNGTYKKIGDVDIKSLEVKSYLAKIVEIKIITTKDENIMRALKKLYGEPTFSVRTNAWEWRSESVLLSLNSINKNRLELKYSSLNLKKYIKDHKEKGIEEISSDF